jgi:HTH-type transcriptional regulator/antitoxin HigA
VSTVPGFSKSHALRSEAEYAAAVWEIEGLLDLDPPPGTEACDRLEFLSVLVEHCEEGQYPTGPVSPREAVDLMLEQRGLGGHDLHDAMDGRSRVSEFLSGKRELSEAQVEALH